MGNCQFEVDRSESYGTHGGIPFVRHVGTFHGTLPASGDDIAVPCELVAPKDPSAGAPVVVVEAPHVFSGRPLGRDVYLLDDVLFGSGLRHGWISDPGPEALAAFARCLRAAPPAELGAVEAVYGIGFSSSGDALAEILSADYGHGLFDFAFPATTSAAVPRRRSGARILRFNTESDLPDRPRTGREAEADDDILDQPFRWYVATSGPHIPDTPETAGSGPPVCSVSGSTPLDWTPIARALFVAGHRWVREGIEPPPSRLLRIDFQGNVVRDDDGHALGGVRLPMLSLDLPDTPRPRPGDRGNGIAEARFRAQQDAPCTMIGTYEEPRSIGDEGFFATPDAYVAAFEETTKGLREEGFLLEADAKAWIQRARGAARQSLTFTEAYDLAHQASAA